ncbi:hypothetical protein ANO11243_070460 [Dothideomycetidae sp. 11243]|nr:hypothetical protein ANO11243_070460 [fungal sp. No.11243]
MSHESEGRPNLEAAKPAVRTQAKLSNISWPISSIANGSDRKRRKVHHNGDLASVEPLVAQEMQGSKDEVSPDVDLLNPSANYDAGRTPTTEQPTDSLSITRTPPTKMLKLNASGGLGSPLVSVAHDVDENARLVKPKRRGRPKRSLVVICRYKAGSASDDTSLTGQRIRKILAGEERLERVPTPIKNERTTRPATVQPIKSTHPFFTGKLKKGPAADTAQHKQDLISVTTASPERKSFASTPGKIRMQVQQMKAARSAAPIPVNQSEPKLRTASAKGEIWPAPGTLHVRGREDMQVSRPQTQSMPLRKKKVASDVTLRHANDKSRLRADGFSDPHPSLRVPARSLLTGFDMYRDLESQLTESHASYKPAKRIVQSLPTHLTAYDLGRGETLLWTHKYAPPDVSAVLQEGHEAEILRDWMRLLTVSSVSSSSLTVPRPAADAKSRRKRRKKAVELDDFIVSSGDEADQLGELSGLEELGSQGSNGERSRSLVRSTRETIPGEVHRLANAVLLSGPHGCGKTAMVHAAAKELNFQVFEINAGSRRSGRDVLERIGDVIGNHIVSHNKPDMGNISADEDSGKISAAFQKDLDSGRQGTMNSFFKSATAKPKPVPKKPSKIPQVQVLDEKSTKPTKSPPSRQQKQSVILFEEIDVLFDEDKSFWTTVLSLLLTSRRPVVFTCTEELAVPWDELTLQAVLRLSAPPPTSAVDYLLLVAAQEGHLLARQAVEILYEQKRHDLRASITELQFWCQMGIGDPRGGLGWIFQRWPPGTGIDTHGNAQRVVSLDTYLPGMGSFPGEREDFSNDQKQEAMLSEAWLNWGLDPRDQCHTDLPLAIAGSIDHSPLDPPARLQALRRMASLTDTLSALDVHCQLDLPCSTNPRSRFAPLGSSLHAQLNATQPVISTRHKSSYTEYPALIQADEAKDPTQSSQHLAVSICALLPAAMNIAQSQELKPRLHMLSRQQHPHVHLQAVSTNEIYGALEPLAEATSAMHSGTYTSLVLPIPALTTDVAPYIRLIAAHDDDREEQRKHLYGALHGDASQGKMRRTRAARSALEGKGRGGVRRERWWDCDLDLGCTAGEHITAAGRRVMEWCAAERTKAQEEEDAHMGEE